VVVASTNLLENDGSEAELWNDNRWRGDGILYHRLPTCELSH
jgi:hypothetical protein